MTPEFFFFASALILTNHPKVKLSDWPIISISNYSHWLLKTLDLIGELEIIMT
jgi:hypothetical protein